MANNDNKVLLLKQKVEENKATLASARSFQPKTHCSLVFQGERIGLRAETSPERLTAILVYLNSLRMSAADLNLEEAFVYENFKIQDWIDDVQSRLAYVNIKKEEGRLKNLEAQLHALLSSDKKVELEVEALEKLI
jgi:hypothetical protein